MLTNLDFLKIAEPWPPVGEVARLALYRENALLRAGDFETAWPDLAKYLRKGETTKGLEFCLDYPDLITTKTQDLIIGEPPSFSLPDTGVEGTENPLESVVTEFVERINFLETLDALIGNLDSLGDGVLKLIQGQDAKVKILNIDPANWFPIVRRGTEEIEYHVLAFKYRDNDKCYLETEIHSKEFIEHRIYLMNEAMSGRAGTISEKLDWATYHPDIKEVEDHKIGDFLVTTCHNKSDGIYGKSSYKPSVKAILKKLIIRFALEHDTLDTFMRPTFFGPSEYQDIDPITKKPIFRPGGYIGINPDPGTQPVVPGGLTWDAHLGENEVSKESLMKQLFNASEMSPVLFAGFAVGMAPSGTALRLLLTNTLAKCGRIRRKVDGSARKALNLGLSLEGSPVDGLYIEWKDGLPRIPEEEARRFQLYAMTPQFAGELGGQYLLKEFGYSDEEAKLIMSDPTRGGGLGGGT
jgi:hypothetical protein